MTVSLNTSGAQLAVITTEHTLATITTPGVFQLVVDLAALAAGDTVELRIYGKARSSDTERLLQRATYGPVPLVMPLVQGVPTVTPHYYRATLKQTAGTGRTFPWAVYET